MVIELLELLLKPIIKENLSKKKALRLEVNYLKAKTS